MEIINVVKQDTVYTFSFTEKELKVLMTAVGSFSPLDVQQKLSESFFINKFNTADYTVEDSRKIYKLWEMFCEAMEITP